MEKKDGCKLLNIRMPKDLWIFLKQCSMQKEKSMNQIVLTAINRYRNTENELLSKEKK